MAKKLNFVEKPIVTNAVREIIFNIFAVIISLLKWILEISLLSVSVFNHLDLPKDSVKSPLEHK